MMIPFNQQLDQIYACYLNETDARLLDKQLTSLTELINNPALYDDKREDAKALKLRLDAKLRLLQYVDGFDERNYQEAVTHFTENLEIAKNSNYGKTQKAITSLQGFAERLYELVNKVGQYAKLFETNAETVADSAICNKAIEEVERSKRLLQLCNLVCDVPRLKLVDMRQLALDFLEKKECVFLQARKNLFETKISNSVKDITYYKENTYFPLPENDEGGKANALVLSTPLTDDARLFAANCCGTSRKLLCVSAFDLNNKPQDFFRSLFQYVNESNAYCIVEGADTLTIETSNALLLEAMKIGKLGLKVFVSETSGRAQLYKQALELTNEEDDLTVADVSLEYVSLPVFQEVKQLFEEREMANPSTSGDLLKKMPFMGFCGLNQVVKAFVARSKNWQEVGKHASSVNKQSVLNYLENVAATYLLIDSGWGDYSQYDKRVAGFDGEFDYDGVKSIDLYNVKQIVESNESVFAKCGMLARYCTVGSDDVSAWAKLDRQEMLERITLAVRLVMKILRVTVVPEVELLDELENSTAGGVCVDGGKVIRFQYSSALDVQFWLFGAIVHESFHALQSQLTHGQWHEWYYDNMGISRGRVSEWRKTHDIYDHNTNSKVYKVHIYEADARAFEIDCDDGRNKAWNSMNFR